MNHLNKLAVFALAVVIALSPVLQGASVTITPTSKIVGYGSGTDEGCIVDGVQMCYAELSPVEYTLEWPYNPPTDCMSAYTSTSGWWEWIASWLRWMQSILAYYLNSSVEYTCNVSSVH